MSRRVERGATAESGYQLTVREGRSSRREQIQMRRAKDRDEGAVMSDRQRPPTGSMLLFHAGRPNTSRRTAQPTIVEDPGAPPRRAGALVVREQQPAFPWESQAVRTLAKKVGSRDPSATPMMVEGREGTILAAVGDQADHKVAAEVLKYHQTQRRQAQLADAAAQGFGDGIENGVGPLERCAYARARAQACVCACVSACLRVCVSACLCVCGARMCVRVCACVTLCVRAPGWRDASAIRALSERRRSAEAMRAIGS